MELPPGAGPAEPGPGDQGKYSWLAAEPVAPPPAGNEAPAEPPAPIAERGPVESSLLDELIAIVTQLGP